MGRRIAMLLVLGVVLLTACSGGGAAAPASRTPEEVHQAWIAALERNDLPALLQLIHPPMPDTLVMDRLRQVQGIMTGDSAWGAYVGRGPAFVRSEGAQQVGLSTWQVAKHTYCYRTEMAQFDGQWKVVNFHDTEARDCQST